jgi:hypothetical protein
MPLEIATHKHFLMCHKKAGETARLHFFVKEFFDWTLQSKIAAGGDCKTQEIGRWDRVELVRWVIITDDPMTIASLGEMG